MEDQEIGEEDEFEDHFDGYNGPLGEELLHHFQLEGKEAENVCSCQPATKHRRRHHGRHHEHVSTRHHERPLETRTGQQSRRHHLHQTRHAHARLERTRRSPQISHISKAKQPTGSLGTQGSQQRAQSGYQQNNSDLKADPQAKPKDEFDYRYAFKSRPKIVNDF